MEKMEVDDDTVVDLSVSNTNSVRRDSTPSGVPTNSSNTSETNRARRVLRPRTEPRRYTESPDTALNGNGNNKYRANGTADSDSSEGEMPPLLPIKELSPAELWQRERGLRRLREELRAEEMKLVLLKKLRQSQQLKENVAQIPPTIPPQVLPPTGLPSGLSITPTTVKISSKNQQPQAAHSRHSNSGSGKTNNLSHVPPLLRGQPPPARSSLHAPPLSNNLSASSIRGLAANLSVPQPPQRSSLNRSNFPAVVKDLSPAVTITPAPPQSIKPANNIMDNKALGGTTVVPLATPLPPSEPQQEQRSREESQTPAQRQAAAKLALRKQLEKTLLQIPPPKPPPPEMHFIPNPSNTEFIYLVGLEHVVDFLTKEPRPPAPPTPFQCQQCRADFTPVWKWEKQNKNRQSNATFQQAHGKDPRVICEQCVTSNVKKALKAEHTNRLKTAFVKALQQEQEIEQRLAQVSCNSPAPSPVAPEPSPSPKSAPTPTPRHAATPPAPPPAQPTPPPRQSHANSHNSSHSSSHSGSHNSSHSSSQSQQDKFHQSAAAMQALQQQFLRGLSGGPANHMLPLNPLFYPYLAMSANAGGKSAAASLAEIQRAADLHRQYLLDMIPPQAGQSRHNWKT